MQPDNLKRQGSNSRTAGGSRLLSFSIAAGLIVGGCLVYPSAASAASGDPFDDAVGRGLASFGEFSGNSTDGSTQLYSVTVDDSGKFAFTAVGSATAAGEGYNSIGYREADGYVYGVRSTAQASGNFQLLRIDSNGVPENLGPVPGAEGLDNRYYSASAAFGTGAYADNFYYDIKTWSGEQDSTLRWVTFEADGRLTPHSLQMSTTVDLSDFTALDGYLWGQETPHGAQPWKLVRIDLATGQVDKFTAPAVIDQNAPGFYPNQTWTLPNGNIVLGMSGLQRMFQISISEMASASPTFSVVSIATSPADGGSGDATYIPSRVNNVDLKIEKSGPAEVDAGATVEYTVTVTNLSDTPSSGSSVHDALPAGLEDLRLPTGATRVGNDVYYQVGALNPGESSTMTYSGKAPAQAPSGLTNAVTVVGDETDPELGNNHSEVTTEVHPVDPVDPSVAADADADVNASASASASADADADSNPAAVAAAQAAAMADASSQASAASTASADAAASAAGNVVAQGSADASASSETAAAAAAQAAASSAADSDSAASGSAAADVNTEAAAAAAALSSASTDASSSAAADAIANGASSATDTNTAGTAAANGASSAADTSTAGTANANNNATGAASSADANTNAAGSSGNLAQTGLAQLGSLMTAAFVAAGAILLGIFGIRKRRRVGSAASAGE